MAFQTIETRIKNIETKNTRLEDMMGKLAQGNKLCNDVIVELAHGITNIVSNEVKNQVKEELITTSQEIKSEVITTVGDTIIDTVNEAVAERGLNRKEIRELTNTRNHRMMQLLGNSKCDKYILFAPFYQSQMGKEYRKKFECIAYGDVNANRLDEAKNFLKNFTISQQYHEWCEKTLRKNYLDNEIESVKKINAYKRYYGISESSIN